MLINKQISNIFYTQNRINHNQAVNILYEKSESFFDAAMLSETSHSLVPICMTTGSSSFIENSFYSAAWVNDIINFSQKIPAYANYYTSYILAIHSAPSTTFKREDLVILKNNIGQYNFLCFNPIKNSWPMENITHIQYGINRPKSHYENKHKNILVLNLKRQKQIDILYQYLKQKFPLTDILHENILDIDTIHSVLSQYKVCIDIDNYYNLLVANACGCIGITSVESHDQSIINIDSSNQIFDILPKLITNDAGDSKRISDTTIKKYNWEEFCQNINNYKNKILSEGFVV